jgi:hypothetical protein
MVAMAVVNANAGSSDNRAPVEPFARDLMASGTTPDVTW